jgi:hypothetical protein
VQPDAPVGGGVPIGAAHRIVGDLPKIVRKVAMTGQKHFIEFGLVADMVMLLEDNED